MDNIKPNNERPKKNDASSQWSFPTADRKKVESIPIKANIIRNFFFALFLSANNPINGAKIMSNRLAEELEIPSINVLSVSGIVDAKFSAKMIG